MLITALIRRRVAMMAVPLALAGSLATATSATASRDDTVSVRIDLARAQAATARYNYEPFAVADGYQRDDHCVEAPGLGAMGIHYVNFERLGAMDVTRPDILLYANGPGGRRQLVAVEYFQAKDPNVTTDADRPSLFGHPFDGPMPGHFLGQPVHYDLHVWLWRANPAGLFTPFNPALSCS